MPTIETGVPLPPEVKSTRSQGISSTIRELEVGQSFEVPREWKIPTVKAIAYSMAPGQRSYTVAKDATGAWRVWRTK